MTEYTIGGTGFVLIEVEDTHERKAGLNGSKIDIDVSFDPMRHARNCGKVIQLPSNLGGKPVTQEPIGYPAYGAIRGDREEADVHPAIYTIGGVFSYRLMQDIAQEVRIGDKIWFKPRVLNNPINKIDEIKDSKGKKKYIFKVEYDQIICAIRDYDISKFDGANLIGTPEGMSPEQFQAEWAIHHPKVKMPDFKDMVTLVNKDVVTARHFIMIGSWCLLKPVLEDWGTIFKKTYFETLDEKGRKKEKPQKDWLQIKTQPEKEKMRGIVKFFGTPLRGDECELEPNTKVWIRKVASDWILEIEGSRYLVCRQNQIMAQVEDGIPINEQN